MSPKAMSDGAPNPLSQVVDTQAGGRAVPVWDIFVEFLIIGATSFGGVVPYLRTALVSNRHWIDDKEFVEMGTKECRKNFLHVVAVVAVGLLQSA
jgi:Chromate transporter